jgi:RND family efflux transporter MFP subunit
MAKKIIYIAVAIVLVVFTVFRLKSNKEMAEKRVYQYDREKPIPVYTTPAVYGNAGLSYTWSGTFEPDKESKISADIQGKVNHVAVDLGGYVSKGQTLIKLDDALLRLQLKSTEIQIEGLETDVKRFSILAEADAIQGVQLEKAGLGLKTAKVQKETLLVQIDKTTIRAPFNGIVTAMLTEEGAFAAPGVPLIQITDISSLRFTVNIPEDKLDLFHPGQLCQVSADVYPDLSLTGRVIMVGSKANPGNSYPVQLAVKNSGDLKIKSGMFGKVTLQSENKVKRVAIPASAISGTSLQPQVYIVTNDRARLQNIVISGRSGDQVLVSEGLVEGDQIVTAGFINLYDGASVILK